MRKYQWADSSNNCKSLQQFFTQQFVCWAHEWEVTVVSIVLSVLILFIGNLFSVIIQMNSLSRAILWLSLVTIPTEYASAACGDIEIAEGDTTAAEILANIDKLILQAGYNCTVQLVPGDAKMTLAAMAETGRPDIANAITVSSTRPVTRDGNGNGKNVASQTRSNSLLTANPSSVSGVVEGWWTLPATVKRHPELKTVLDILEHRELFADKENPAQSSFHGCPAGTACEQININLFRAFDMEANGWKLITPESMTDLADSAAQAIEQGENWFGYFRSPAMLAAKYDMVPLEFGVEFAGSKNWNDCITRSAQDCAEPKPSAWAPVELQTVVTDKFRNHINPEIMDYLSNRMLPGEILNSVLSYKNTSSTNQSSSEQLSSELLSLEQSAVEQSAAEPSSEEKMQEVLSPEKQAIDIHLIAALAATKFLHEHTEIWEKWVSADVAEKIRKQIESQATR